MSVQETVRRLVLDWAAAVLDGLDEDERVPSVLRAPASAEAIAALEQWLNPRSYGYTTRGPRGGGFRRG